jgi:tetratricopeptide (TPR) repeat protein
MKPLPAPIAKLPAALLGLALALVLFQPAPAREKPRDEWQVRENLVTRLGGELYKIGVLKKELQNIHEILLEARDIEVFPTEMTRLGEEALLSFDKSVEQVMKKHQAILEQVDAMRPPLVDGIAILREMIVGQPVEDMFQVLDNDDIRRISAMFTIKHHIDSLWRNVDGLLIGISTLLQIGQDARAKHAQGSESEFLEILKANLGQQSERFKMALDGLKDSLFQRGAADQRERMFQAELSRARSYLKSGSGVSAKKKLVSLAARFKEPRFVDECNKLLVRVNFTQGDFEGVLASIKLLPESLSMLPDVMIDEVQSMYSLKHYADLWAWGNRPLIKTLAGASRNKALWLTMESGLILGKTDSITRLASLAVRDSSYQAHIVHCLGRSYVKAGNLAIAQAMFESALHIKPQRKVDDEALSHVSLSLAQLLYERGDYRKSLALFFELLNNEKTFAEALFGISWCYISLDDNPKAETTLRKLINQVPSSALSAEALVLNMRQFDVLAKNDWAKSLYLSNEEQRLIEKKRMLLERAAADTTVKKSEKLTRLLSKIDELLARLRQEKKPSPRDIAASYDKIPKIAKLINAYYGTGTFQEVSFSEKRERLLREVDSLIIVSKEIGPALAGAEKFSRSVHGVAAVKSVVRKSKAFAVMAMIDRYRWERDHIDWQKTNAKRALDDLVRAVKAAADSAKRAELAAGQKKQKDLIDSLVRAGDFIKEEWRNVLLQKCSELLVTPMDSADEAYIRYHLGEIHYEHENDEYAEAFTAFEDSMTAFDSLYALYRDGKILALPKRPIEPRMNHAASLEQYRIVLKKFPTSDLIHAVRYGLAWCYNDQGMFDSAITCMETLVGTCPASPYAPQAWMYIGEYMFDHVKLDSALKAYQSVMKYPESEWFDKALYKLAWTQYRLSNPEKAIGSFLALVDLGEGSRLGKTLLEKESIDYIAISFSETDATGQKGLDRATKFVNRFGDRLKGAQILHRLAEIFKEQGRFDMAQKTYATLLRMYPENKNSPLVEAELLAVLEKSNSTEDANLNRIEYFNKYNKNSAWAKMQEDPSTRRFGDSLAAKLLYDASVSYHQLALQKNDSAIYGAAMENYEAFITNYPLLPQAGECHYNLAEIMFSMGNYTQAAEEYITVSKRYPGSKYKETAAWNAIVASQNLLKKEKAMR